MSLLTDQEIHAADPAPHERFDQERIDFARAIEAAVIARLATVSVEPVAHGFVNNGKITDALVVNRNDDPEYNVPLYPPEAIAAARVQENEKIANWYYNEGHRLAVFEVAPAIRALITDKGQ